MRRREPTIHRRSRRMKSGRSGTRITVTPTRAGWEVVSFGVRTIASGHRWRTMTGRRELCLVLLSGRCRVEWSTADGVENSATLGPRTSVFDAYPHALYLP